MDGLKSRGECTNELLINLFLAYQVASDENVLVYIKTKRCQYDNGYNMSIDELMTSALKFSKLYARTTSGTPCPRNKR